MQSPPPAHVAPVPWPLALSAGALMGAADAVPGVSGGTIALVLGVYERLIESIGVLVRLPVNLRDGAGRKRVWHALRFLVPLVLGVGAAYFVGTRVLVGPAEAPGLLRRPHSAPLCYAFFLGLVLFSLPEPWRRIARRTKGTALAALLACAAVAWAVGLEHAAGTPQPWMFLYGGALAVAVMLLPGISGSLMLLVIGQYTHVAGALHDGDLSTLGIFLAGVALGLVLFVPLLRALLRRRHDLTMAALTGLMAGSLRALWPWKSHYDLKATDMGRMANVGVGGNWTDVLLFAALGAAAVWGLRWLERRIEGTSAPTA